MKKQLIFVLACFSVVTNTVMPAEAPVQDDLATLAQKMAYARDAYNKYESSLSLGERMRARFGYADADNDRLNKLIAMRAYYKNLRDQIYDREVARGSMTRWGRLWRQYRPEMITAASLLAALSLGGGYLLHRGIHGPSAPVAKEEEEEELVPIDRTAVLTGLQDGDTITDKKDRIDNHKKNRGQRSGKTTPTKPRPPVTGAQTHRFKWDSIKNAPVVRDVYSDSVQGLDKDELGKFLMGNANGISYGGKQYKLNKDEQGNLKRYAQGIVAATEKRKTFGITPTTGQLREYDYMLRDAQAHRHRVAAEWNPLLDAWQQMHDEKDTIAQDVQILIEFLKGSERIINFNRTIHESNWSDTLKPLAKNYAQALDEAFKVLSSWGRSTGHSFDKKTYFTARSKMSSLRDKIQQELPAIRKSAEKEQEKARQSYDQAKGSARKEALTAYRKAQEKLLKVSRAHTSLETAMLASARLLGSYAGRLTEKSGSDMKHIGQYKADDPEDELIKARRIMASNPVTGEDEEVLRWGQYVDPSNESDSKAEINPVFDPHSSSFNPSHPKVLAFAKTYPNSFIAHKIKAAKVVVLPPGQFVGGAPNSWKKLRLPI